MQLIGFIVTACLVLAILRAAVAVVAVMLLITIVIGAVRYPAQTFVLLGFGLAASLIEHHPTIALASLAMLVAVAIASRSDNPKGP